MDLKTLMALLNGCIEQYGRIDYETILVSQKLDKLIVKEQRELINK